MPRATPWKDEYTLLCERCGYVVDGLDTEGNCPECGKPIAESLPERRTGTPWEKHPSAGSYIRTVWQTLTCPGRVLDSMALCQPRRASKLRHANLLCSVAVFFVTWVVLMLFAVFEKRDMDSDSVNALMNSLAFGLMISGMAWGILELTTQFVALVLRYLGHHRQYRLTPRISAAICSHGAAGWLLGSLGFVASSVSLFVLYLTSDFQPGYGAIRLPFLLFAGGFLYFTFFSVLGLHRLKFANVSWVDSNLDPRLTPDPSRTAHSFRDP